MQCTAYCRFYVAGTVNCMLQVLDCAKSIMSADSAARKAELEAMEMTWDGEVRIVSKYSRFVSND